jgi:hypothetical protein
MSTYDATERYNSEDHNTNQALVFVYTSVG